MKAEYNQYTQVNTSISTCALQCCNPQVKSDGISLYPTTSSMVEGGNSNICRAESESHMAELTLYSLQAEPYDQYYGATTYSQP